MSIDKPDFLRYNVIEDKERTKHKTNREEKKND